VGGELTDRQIGHSGRTAHIDALDGLRGLAVVAVVAYHLGWGWAKGGYLGVDAFLVLSGYLITSILLTEHSRTGRIGLLNFWRRRARRLLPALVVLLAAVALWSRFAVLPDEAHRLRLDGLSALFFVSNWRFILTGQGYFAATAMPSLLRHTWSLAVEGQLYLIWAPAVVLLSRRGRRWVAAAAGTGAVASAVWGMVLVHNAAGINRAYYGTDTRAVSFLIGALVAAVLARPAGAPRRGAGLLGLVGLVITGGLWATLPGSSVLLFRGGLVVAAVAAAAVVVSIVTHPAGAVSRALAVPVLRGLGRVSYGIYLWHWPLFLVLDHGRTGLSGVELLAVRLGALALATTLSWVLIERPILERRLTRVPRPAVVTAIGALSAAGLLVPLLAPSSTGAVTAASAAPGQAVQAAVFGDSVSVTLARGLMAAEAPYGVVVHNDGIVGCGVVTGTQVRSIGIVAAVPPQCLVWESTWQAAVTRDRPEVAVLVLGRWELLDRVVDGTWQHIGQPGYDRYITSQLDRAIAIAGSGGATVMLCTVPYFDGLEEPGGGTFPENQPSRVTEFNQLVRAEVARHPGVELFDLNALVSPHGRYAATIAGTPIRTSDGVHFSVTGGEWVARRLLPAVRQAATLAN
jgi:peptidoglycan/LPS O-acetylase OafA/YrhL